MVDTFKEDLKNANVRLKVARKNKQDAFRIEDEIANIKEKQKENKSRKKNAEKRINELEKQIVEETKPIIKQKFEYDIPIAKVEDAGITTTGAASEGNQLPGLVKEYREYCNKHNLWEAKKIEYSYMKKDEIYYRIGNNEEVELNEQ